MKTIMIMLLSFTVLSCMNKGRTEDPVTKDNVDSLPSTDLAPNASISGSTYSTPIGEDDQTSSGGPGKSDSTKNAP